jgi:hypothetical protein
MFGLDIAAAAGFYVLALLMIVRAVKGRYLSQFSFLFSYVIYLLLTGLVVNVLDIAGAQFYVTAFWLRFFTLVLAEFVLLLEIGDHIFRPYPALRQLGRLVTLGITLIFSSIYILPSLWAGRPTNIAILDLMKRSTLTKGIIIIALVAVARACRIRLGRNVAGLILGLAAYLTINTANFALAETYGRELYGPVFGTIGPLSQTLCVLIWTVALWRVEPVSASAGAAVTPGGEIIEPLPDRLGRFNTAVGRFLKR